MKKVLFIFALALSFAAMKAQSGLTLLISDKVETGYFKQSDFKWAMLGLKNATEATTFANNLKKNKGFKTVTLTPSATPGQYDVAITMEKTYDGKFFERVMYANGVAFVKYNGETKPLPTEEPKKVNKAVGQ
ncbi:MAG: hypothetical protein IAF38_17315 [Bacteroidia bacterium]|nr:hypothetical protein [Bacteroidia bacterium]